MTEDRPIPKAESGKAVALSNLGKFHAGVDTLGKWVPERLTHQFALDPNKWEHTFYSLTLKEPKKIRYYRPKNVDIVPGTLVGDMAIANQFYRTKDPAEQEKYALAYLASLKPYPVNLDDYEFPELLIPRNEQGVAEGAKCNHTMEGAKCPVHGLKECGSYGKVEEMSAGSVATVVNPPAKNKSKVGTLFGGTYKQKKVKEAKQMTFPGENTKPPQRPGDQVRGTEKATKPNPFKHRLVGNE